MSSSLPPVCKKGQLTQLMSPKFDKTTRAKKGPYATVITGCVALLVARKFVDGPNYPCTFPLSFIWSLSVICPLIVRMTAQTTECELWNLPFWPPNNEFHSTWPLFLEVMCFFGWGFHIHDFPTDSPN